MKCNNQQWNKPLIPKSENNNIIDDELFDETTILEQTTQSFSEIMEFDSKQQIEIKHSHYNNSEQVFKQKQLIDEKFKLEDYNETLNGFILKYKPKNITLNAKLKPFIPDYEPALSQVENGLSIPRPDGQFDNYGIYDVREPPIKSQIDKNYIMQKVTKKEQKKVSPTSQKNIDIKYQQNVKNKDEKQENLEDLFRIISKYKPERIEIQQHLKPFIPDYIPQVLNPDPMLKVPRPDGKVDHLGLTVLDERKVKGIYMQ